MGGLLLRRVLAGGPEAGLLRLRVLRLGSGLLDACCGGCGSQHRLAFWGAGSRHRSLAPLLRASLCISCHAGPLLRRGAHRPAQQLLQERLLLLLGPH